MKTQDSDSDTNDTLLKNVKDQAHLVFTQVKAYAETVLGTSTIQEFDNLCDILLDQEKDISPLLLHYDALKQYTGI